MKSNTIYPPMSEREISGAAISREAATQGMVLLKNINGVLPLKGRGKIALFGNGAARTIRGGTGSGDPFNGGLSGGGDQDVDQSLRYHINILNAMETEGFVKMYEVGRSQNALMVVRSYGIDPATGNEIYIKRDGSLTFEYDPNDKVEVGNTTPKLQGYMNSNLTWKGLNLYMQFSYELGAKMYNSTLAQKVEGADPKYNADRRVLYDRWKQPGDIAMFRRIDDQSTLYQSSRLVQKNNFLKLSSLSLSYDLPRRILEKSFIERCKFTFSMTDVFYLSTIKQERGTSYPFARTFSLGANITF